MNQPARFILLTSSICLIAGCGSRSIVVAPNDSRVVVLQVNKMERPALDTGESFWVYKIESKEDDDKVKWPDRAKPLLLGTYSALTGDISIGEQGYGNIFHLEIYASAAKPAKAMTTAALKAQTETGPDLIPFYDAPKDKVSINRYQVRREIGVNNIKYGIVYVPVQESSLHMVYYSAHPALLYDASEAGRDFYDGLSIDVGAPIDGLGGDLSDRYDHVPIALGGGWDMIKETFTFGLHGGALFWENKKSGDIEIDTYVGVTFNVGQLIGILAKETKK